MHYVGGAGVLVDLRNEVRLVWRLFTTKAEAKSSIFGEVVIGVGVVEVAGRSVVLVVEDVNFFGGAIYVAFYFSS